MRSTLLLLIIHVVSSLRINIGTNSGVTATRKSYITSSTLFMSSVGDNDEMKSELYGIGGNDGSTSKDELPDDAFGAPVGPLPTVSSSINMGEVVIDENNLG